METLLIKNANIVNEGKIRSSDVLISNGLIEKIELNISVTGKHRVIDAHGSYLFPGVIDDQVHFREPGLTHKGDIYTESRAAVAGGVTSYMEMPNTIPNSLTQVLLEDKYRIAAAKSMANYSFYMGASNDNLEEVLKTDPARVCGIKVFMGASTGNMLVDNERTLEAIFRNATTLIATHCEDEATIQKNLKEYEQKYGDNIPFACHPLIRSEEACYLSSSMAVALAKQHEARLHVLHISTEKELSLFSNERPLRNKKITAEACIHHLWFETADYETKGSLIKWNPAIKNASDRQAIFSAVIDGTIDVVATDHAPHTLQEKQQPYTKAPSGGPLVQHTLVAMLEFFHQGKISLEQIAEKMCHNPSILFQIDRRGFIREGYHADLVLVDVDHRWVVATENILSKCGWSPFTGHTFRSRITHTIVSGEVAYADGQCKEGTRGMRLEFRRM